MSAVADVDVLVVGAGITGIYQLYRAREAGFSAQLLEAGGGVGGTWYWNRYPGARFDSESYTYGYLFSKELFDEWEWQEHFAEQPETERYLNHVVDRFDLRRHMRFDAPVTVGRVRRVVRDVDGRGRRRHRVSGRGSSSPRPASSRCRTSPTCRGATTSAASSTTPGRWPAAPVDFAGKRVAVIGTGSSGVQLIPAIAGEVASLTVYQRTANWCTPLNNAPITPDEQARLRADFEAMRETLNTSRERVPPPARTIARPSTTPTRSGGRSSRRCGTAPASRSSRATTPTCCSITPRTPSGASSSPRRSAASSTDPETAEKLIPKDHRFGEKRPPVRDRLLRGVQPTRTSRSSISSETPIVRMTERGIETADGVREFDIVVWATGFDFGTGALTRMGIRGRDGLALEDHWADGPKTFLGVQTAGFPNLFFPGGPHAAAGNNPRYNGDQVDFVTDTLIYVRDHGYDTIEVDPAAEERWTGWSTGVRSGRPSFGESSYYFGTNIPGKPRKYLLNAGGRPKLFKEIDRVRRQRLRGVPALPLGHASGDPRRALSPSTAALLNADSP